MNHFNLELKETAPSFLNALWRIYKINATGILTIKWKKFKKQIVFKKGEALATRSNWAHDTFAYYLIHKKNVSEEIIRSHVQKIKTQIQPKILADSLLSEGVLKTHEISVLLENHLRERIFNFLPLAKGSINFSLLELDESVMEPCRLTLPWLQVLCEALRAFLTPEICQQRLQSHWHNEARIQGACLLPLNGKELRLWNQLMQNAKLPASSDPEMLWIMAVASELEVVEWAESQVHQAVRQFKELEEKFQKSNAFEILGVSKEASPDQCKKAYLELAKKFHPDHLLPEASQELKNMAQNVFSRINEAHAVLIDPEKRKEYEAQLAVGSMDVQTHLEAEMLINQAKAALKRHHYKEALDFFNTISQTIKNDGEILSDQVFAEFMFLVETKHPYKERLAEFRNKLQQALELNKSYAAIFYYLGLLSKFEGNWSRALSEFEQAMKQNPKLSEAASEARLIRMRQGKKSS